MIIQNEFENSISIIDGYKYIILQEDSDNIYLKHNGERDFEITKSDRQLYNIFEKLFSSILNVYSSNCKYDSLKIDFKRIVRCGLLYNLLYDESKNKIKLRSDDNYKIILEIQKLQNKFAIKIYNKSKDNKNNLEFISVKISKFKSMYFPYNIEFINMYEDIKSASITKQLVKKK